MSPSPFQAHLIRKAYHEANYLAGDVGDRIDLKIRFVSSLPRDVRAFKGRLIIKDLFDQEVLVVGLTDEGGIPAEGTREWDGYIQFNQFLAGHQRLLQLDVKDAQVEFGLESVIYRDGDRQEFS